MAFNYGKTQLGKKAYNLFLNPFGNFDKVMYGDYEHGKIMKAFVASDSVLATGASVTITDDSPTVILFNSSSATTVTNHATDGKVRYLFNTGSAKVTVGSLILGTNHIGANFVTTTTFQRVYYLPIGYCESGISFNITKGDEVKASTGQEFVASENVEVTANVFGLDDYVRTLLNTLQTNASIGMVSNDGSAIFIKNIVPFAEINAVSNDQNMTKITIKKENPLIEVI